MSIKTQFIAGTALLGLCLATPALAEDLTIATVNNSDMIIMQELSTKWEEATGNKLNWLVLEENVLRQRVTTDIATSGGQFDIITIGSFEAPLWGATDWLTPLDDLPASYDLNDVFEPVRNALTSKDHLVAVPFYAESSFTFYRKDLFEKAGLTMPEHPTYTQIGEFAAKLNDPAGGIYGICLRGKPGWGENMAFIGTMANSFGGRYVDMDWQPQLTSDAWKKAVTWYVDTMTKYGPPGATSNGHNENRALFASGKCAMWVDATSAAGFIYNPAESQVADKTAFTAAPAEVTPNGSGWNWAWALAIPASSTKADAAKSFLAWATSKEYIQLVGETKGWVSAPPGTRASTYANADYIAAAPFAETTKNAVLTADPTKATLEPVPYVGTFYMGIPEWQGIGTSIGQELAAALAGTKTVDEALEAANAATLQALQQAGYAK